MSTALIKITITGTAGLEFKIIPRDRGDEPPPPVVEAALNANGTARVYLPRGYYVVTARGLATQIVQPVESVPEYSVALT